MITASATARIMKIEFIIESHGNFIDCGKNGVVYFANKNLKKQVSKNVSKKTNIDY